MLGTSDQMRSSSGGQPGTFTSTFTTSFSGTARGSNRGITGVAEADEARRLGLELIVTDHHEPGPEMPRADVLVTNDTITEIAPVITAACHRY